MHVEQMRIKLKHANLKALDSFSKPTASKIKHAAGLNMNGERIKLIDKNNKNDDCPTCNAENLWEYVMICDTHQ